MIPHRYQLILIGIDIRSDTLLVPIGNCQYKNDTHSVPADTSAHRLIPCQYQFDTLWYQPIPIGSMLETEWNE